MTSRTNDLAALVQAFFQEHLINQRAASKNTVKSYRDMWKLLLQFLSGPKGKRAETCCLDDLTAETIIAFLDHLETLRKCCTRTRNQRLAAIRSFLRYACISKPERLDQFQRIFHVPLRRFERRVRGHLSHEEMESMLNAPDRHVEIGRRHAVLILFLYNTGARVEEATGLTVGQIRFEKPPQVRLVGKRSKERITPLWEDTAQRLAEQIAEQGSAGSPEAPVFVNRHGERLTRGGVDYILKKYQKKAAMSCPSLAQKTISPHTLRHTTAMHLLQSGVDINMIRLWLGHVHFDTTNEYLEANVDMKREALEKGGLTGLPDRPNSWKPTEDILSFLESL